MIAVQEYLRGGKTLDNLQDEFSINVYHHPELPLVGLKYSQIDSPKTHPIVRDCRGTVLEKDTWHVVAKPFRRFFNAGEVVEEYRLFNWGNFTCNTKEDGSLILVYFYRGEWHVNTSGSFGLGECGSSGKAWRDLFWETSKIDRSKLWPGMTYIFELCTIHNKIVRSYSAPVVFLLSVFDNSTCQEMNPDWVDMAASNLGVPRPESYSFASEEEIRSFLISKENTDKTFEGVIIRDDKGGRWKIKAETCVALHHLKDNGNICNPKRMVPLVLAGEIDEVVAYLPEIESHIRDCEARVNAEWETLAAAWRDCWRIEDQKEFALAVLGKTRFAGLLFALRKGHGKSQAEELLREMWSGHAGGIVKVIYG